MNFNHDYSAQKLHRARELHAKGEYELALDIAKAVAFDALANRDFDLLRLAYLRLSTIAYSDEEEADYIEGAIQMAEVVPEAYIETCMNIIHRMLTMPTSKVLMICNRLILVAHGEFYYFVVALSAKLSGSNYSILELPHPLVVKLSQFRVKE